MDGNDIQPGPSDSGLEELQRQVAEFSSGLERLSSGLQWQFTQVTSGLEELQRRLAEISVAFRLPSDIGARMEVAVEAWRDLLAAMAPYGWLIPLSYTMRETYEMLATYRERGAEAVEAKLIDDFRLLTAVGAVAGLERRSAVVKWLPVLTMAAHAHDRGEWPLAIPVWLMATEAVVREHLGIDEAYSTITPNSKKARQARALLAPTGSIAPPAAEALVTVLAGLGKSSRDATVFSRHTVLHGLRPELGIERDSIQCLLALDVLAALLPSSEGCDP